MAWLRIDDKFGHHDKILALTDREFRIHVLTLCYCAEYGTAGTVPKSAWKLLGITESFAKKVRGLGIWDHVGGEEIGEDRIHNWQLYNPKDPTSASRKQRFRERHGNGGGTVEGTEEERSSRARARARVPVPSRSTEEQPPAAADARDPKAAAAETIERLQAIGIDPTTVTSLDHAAAWLDVAEHEAQRNPAGFVITGLATGQPPSPRNGHTPKVDYLERGRQLYERTRDPEAVADWLAGLTISIAERERILERVTA